MDRKRERGVRDKLKCWCMKKVEKNIDKLACGRGKNELIWQKWRGENIF